MVTLAAVLSAADAVDAADTRHARDAQTGAESWETTAHGVRVRVAQILPDQVRGFYGARGFDEDAVELMARHCFFQTIVQNESAPGAIRFELREWRARTGKHEQPPKLLAEWLGEWERRGASPAARTAFRWALFPSEQSYETGDWNMGMTTYALAPGSRFDLRAVWHAGTERREARLTGVRCATEAPAPKNEERP
jgi:hypothetical protein